ncbi:MAG: hypothetical protein LBF85_06755 [Tannerella sp.]|jgi:hypothetical protein|nr:hypothetical protein [Tannerella sp.]
MEITNQLYSKSFLPVKSVSCVAGETVRTPLAAGIYVAAAVEEPYKIANGE